MKSERIAQKTRLGFLSQIRGKRHTRYIVYQQKLPVEIKLPVGRVFTGYRASFYYLSAEFFQKAALNFDDVPDLRKNDGQPVNKTPKVRRLTLDVRFTMWRSKLFLK